MHRTHPNDGGAKQQHTLLTACESAHSSAALLAFPPKPQHNHTLYESAGNAVQNTPLTYWPTKGGGNSNNHHKIHNHYIVICKVKPMNITLFGSITMFCGANNIFYIR